MQYERKQVKLWECVTPALSSSLFSDTTKSHTMYVLIISYPLTLDPGICSAIGDFVIFSTQAELERSSAGSDCGLRSLEVFAMDNCRHCQ